MDQDNLLLDSEAVKFASISATTQLQNPARFRFDDEGELDFADRRAEQLVRYRFVIYRMADRWLVGAVR